MRYSYSFRPIRTLFLCLSAFFTLTVSAQTDEDAFFIRSVYDQALSHGQAYPWLYHLSTDIGGRLAGSPEASAAVDYTRQMLDTMGLDSVYLQACEVPRWVRGEKEVVRVATSAMGSYDLNAVALGNSVGTGIDGVSAPVVEVKNFDELDALGNQGKVKGKIVFFNRPMDPNQINTFAAYGGAVDQRVYGASKAAKHGALAVVVRSMTNKRDDVPHTGTLAYEEGVRKIAAVAISTNDSDQLSRLLRLGEVRVYVRTTCQMLSPVTSYNVIGEIRGSEYPDEIILVGGHLDSWDIGHGAHDDGAGCVQAMDVLQLLSALDYKPKRTLRCVLFMNEENGLAGGRAYWAASNEAEEFHMAAIESDRGGFTPRGFTVDGHEEIFKPKYRQVTEWLPLLEPYGLSFSTGGSGADISGLKDQKGLLFGFKPDSQRYFDFHHTAEDTIDAVNRRELHLGSAAMTSLVYLLDKYGLE
ncbi:MAG: M28 family peptidase [Bacteroidetes bacterium]|nr:M28 family peptidase [Bacteroidota bacterium]